MTETKEQTLERKDCHSSWIFGYYVMAFTLDSLIKLVHNMWLVIQINGLARLQHLAVKRERAGARRERILVPIAPPPISGHLQNTLD